MEFERNLRNRVCVKTLLAVIAWLVTLSLLKKDISGLDEDAHRFRRCFPFSEYGTEFGDFARVFF